VGQLITPTIRLVRPLGHGAMGSVWVADHLRLNAQVVVKFLSPEHYSDPTARTRFEREAALAAQAKSPHVIQVFDYGTTDDGLPYIAMELLEGEDLGKRLKREHVIAPRLFSNWLTQACKGVGRAHKNGVIHRDLKPANIFLCDNDGEVLVKVLDFGVAKGDTGVDFHGTATNTTLGTPLYMAPEQMHDAKDVDHRADLWSLAVVTYRALTGTLPFEGQTIVSLVMKITTSPAEPPSLRRPGLAPEIDAWMARALAKSPAERFSSAKELAQAFAVAAGLQVEAAIEPDKVANRSSGPDASSWPGSSEKETSSGPAFASTIHAMSSGDTPRRAHRPSKSRRVRAFVLGSLVGLAAMGAAVAFVLKQPSSPTSTAPIKARAPHASETTIVGDTPVALDAAIVPSSVASVTPPSIDASAPVRTKTGGRPKVRSPSTKPNPLDMPLQ
jgi:serine/threonine-protein kinase